MRERSGQSVILHRETQRVQVVTANVTGGAARFAALRLEAGDYLALGGTATESGAPKPICCCTRGWRWRRSSPCCSSHCAPWHCCSPTWRSRWGGIAALWIVGLPGSLGAAVGFVTVFGITLRNALSCCRTIGRWWSRSLLWAAAAARLGAMHRLAPILMTASVTALGLLPLVTGTGLAGQEIEGPMAIVILGGLCSSIALTLLVLPTLAARFAPARLDAANRQGADALDFRP